MKHLTTMHLRAIRELYAQGLSDREIAKRLGVSTRTVWDTRIDYGMVSHRAPRGPVVVVTILDDGFVGTYAECSKHLGQKVGSLRQYIRRHPEEFIKEHKIRRKQK